jgi:arylsulfatase A-like enzyme
MEADVELFNYLQAYTGIPRSVTLTPREVSFVTDASQLAEVRPNIFIIVVDSLRRDYLGAYNSEVTFTPAIDQFASESLVFEQAFSRYGATGLSEPSIWVGGMLPHQQYVSPFAPMNPLQTLLRAQGYDAYISVDPILDKILEPEGWVTELDEGRQAGEIELCQSLVELQHRVSGRTDVSTPVFAYTQPQNLHIATITRGGVAAVDETSYGDYYAPYASRLRQLDGCFGNFVDYLKVEGLYDASVVILTSDHGDSLGEGGRFGHAYTIFPEILRIPLIMHVPISLTVGLGVDETGLTFSTDITPTLYTLLGFEPEGRGPGSGRSLFTRRADARHDYVAADHLVASSYGPVYGLISDGGGSVYILDSVNYRDHFYDLTTESNAASGRISSARRRSSREAIRRLLTELNDWYGVPRLARR